MIVSTDERFSRLCEHRGGDDCPGSRQGTDDGHVTVLFFLRRLLEIVEQAFERVDGRIKLLVNETELRQEHTDMRSTCRTDTRRNGQWRLAKNALHVIGLESANAILVQN